MGVYTFHDAIGKAGEVAPVRLGDEALRKKTRQRHLVSHPRPTSGARREVRLERPRVIVVELAGSGFDHQRESLACLHGGTTAPRDLFSISRGAP
jgi:hypothetical protein